VIAPDDQLPLIPLSVLRRAAALSNESVDRAAAGALNAVNAGNPNDVLDVLELLRELLLLSVKASRAASAAIDAPGGTPEHWPQRVDGEVAYLQEVLSVATGVSGVLAKRAQLAGGPR
jgi:hypothetical protein